MTNVTNTGSTTTTTATATTATSTQIANPKSILGKDDFLKLMMTQLQNQDPMKPMDDQNFMGQMAQFSSLEQTANMASTLTQMSTASQVSQGVSLIGHTVDWTDGQTGSSGSGQVSGVTMKNGQITVQIGSDTISPSLITAVR